MVRSKAAVSAYALIILAGTFATAHAQQSDNNWLSGDQGVRQARYNADHGRITPGDPFVDDTPLPQQAITASCNSCDSPSCTSCKSGGGRAGGGCPLGFIHGGGGGQIIVGADWLFLRPTFSQAVAAVETTGFGGNVQTERHKEFNFDWASSPRGFVGFRLDDCCCEILATYTNIRGSTWAECGPADVATGFICNGPNEVLTETTGERLEADMTVKANIYDIEFSKTIMFGCPCWPTGVGCVVDYADCPSCGGCADGCSSCKKACCPIWDLTWTGGVRMADMGWATNHVVNNVAGAALESSNTVMQYYGAGPRVSLRARKYFGSNGGASIFVKGAGSLLLGNYELNTNVSTRGGAQVAEIVDSRRVIPVMEIEAGGSIHLSRNCMLTGGYLLASYFDLGVANNFAGANFQPLDDANIMSFDGGFVRAEIAY